MHLRFGSGSPITFGLQASIYAANIQQSMYQRIDRVDGYVALTTEGISAAECALR